STDRVDPGFANGGINALRFTAAGQVLVAGTFDGLGGQKTSHMVHLDNDGNALSSFKDPLGSSFSGNVPVLLKLATGRILVGANDRGSPKLLNIDSNGALDASFDKKLASGFAGV